MLCSVLLPCTEKEQGEGEAVEERGKSKYDSEDNGNYFKKWGRAEMGVTDVQQRPKERHE